MKQTFSKEERLRSRQLIQTLYKSGNAFFEHPFRIKWMFLDEKQEESIQFLVSVPKHHFKKAVDRNLLKRRMREAIRLNKNEITDLPAISERFLAIAFIYSVKEILPFDRIQQKIILILQRLKKENEKVT